MSQQPEYAYIHRQNYQIPPDNLLNGIDRGVGQIGNGVMDPVRGAFGGLYRIGDGVVHSDPLRSISGIKHIVSQSLTGVEKIATAPKMITNGLFNSVLPSKNDEDDGKIEAIAVQWLLRNESDFVDNKILGIKSGEVWPENERNTNILLRHADDADVIAVELRNEIESTHIVSGLTGGVKQIIFSVGRPIKGVFDIFYKPYECHKKEKSVWSVPKGVVIGLRNTVESPFLVIKDTLNGTKKIVEGVLNTPEAAVKFHNGDRFNSWMGWTKAYKIQNLKYFPGEVGDMLCIQQTVYSHTMIKVNDQYVIHRTADSNSVKPGVSQCEFKNAEAGIYKHSLKQIKAQYTTQSITVVNADYCIAKQDERYLVYKKRRRSDIVKMAKKCCNMHSSSDGWELYSKNCEHFCFKILFGVDISIQIQRIVSLNQ